MCYHYNHSPSMFHALPLIVPSSYQDASFFPVFLLFRSASAVIFTIIAVRFDLRFDRSTKHQRFYMVCEAMCKFITSLQDALFYSEASLIFASVSTPSCCCLRSLDFRGHFFLYIFVSACPLTEKGFN